MSELFNTQLRTYTKMTEAESIGAFVEGAKKASSAARELADANDSMELQNTAYMIHQLGVNCLKLAHMKGMTRNEINEAIALKTKHKIAR